MTVEVLSVTQFLTKVREHGKKEFDNPEEGDAWFDQVTGLLHRAHTRGDGVAIYVNNDLGHPDIGQFQIVSYGSDDAQLSTRHTQHFADTAEKLRLHKHDRDFLPITLPDIGGQINWRYGLEAICPPKETLWEHLATMHGQIVDGLTDADLPHWEERHRDKLHASTTHVRVPHDHKCPHPGCVYREGHDLNVFPHRVEHEKADTHDRLVLVHVKVSGGATEEEAKTIVSRVVESGLANWHDSAGEIGFTADESLGVDAFDRGVDVHFVDATVL